MQIARIAGIPIRLHSSFVLLGLGLMLWQAVSAGLPAAVVGLGLAVMVFGSVLLHELGHALAARVYGISTRDITLYPFGGVASLRAEPASSGSELVIALAGPLVNLLLGALALPLALGGSSVAITFLVLNLGMGLFNLLPAYPMDGGRVLRAILARTRGYVSATRGAIAVGRWLAWAMVAAGIFWNPQLLLVGGFLLYASRQEGLRLQRLVAAAREAGEAGARRVVEAVSLPPRQELWSHPVA